MAGGIRLHRRESALEAQRIGALQLRVADPLRPGADVRRLRHQRHRHGRAVAVARLERRARHLRHRLRHVQCRRHGGRPRFRPRRRPARPQAGHPHQPAVPRRVLFRHRLRRFDRNAGLPPLHDRHRHRRADAIDRRPGLRLRAGQTCAPRSPCGCSPAIRSAAFSAASSSPRCCRCSAGR